MTIDERLERIAERPEALGNTVELLTHDIDALRDAQRVEGKEIGDKIRALAIVAEQKEGRAAQMMGGLSKDDGCLARVADNHEDRISDLVI
jgi:archaellum component FlaC